jgi:predicted PurR-regulated permease PerM
MGIKVEKRHLWLILLALAGIVAVLLLFNLRAKLLAILRPFFIAFLVAYILNPTVNKLQLKMPRIVAIMLVYIFILILILLFISFFLPKIISEMMGIIDILPGYIQELQDTASKMQYAMDGAGIPQSIKEALLSIGDDMEETIKGIVHNMGRSVIGILSVSISLIIVPVIAFYFLKDADYFKNASAQLIPIRARENVLSIARDINRVLNRFIRGQLLVAAIVGLLSSIGLTIVGVDYGIIFGLLLGLFDIIPYFGPIIGSIPALIFALMESRTIFFLALLVIVIVQQLESSIITPKIIGDSVGLHPVYVILFLLIGGSFFGILGMLLAVPTALILRILFSHIIDAITGSTTK